MLNRKTILYGLLLGGASIVLQLIEYKFVVINHSLELYSGILAVIFTVAGIYAGKKITAPREIFIEKTVYIPAEIQTVAAPAVANPENAGLTKREFEILELMAHGHSNLEIANLVFLSVHTVKTHISNIFIKLDVSRRTQAVKKAKELHIIA